MDNEVKVEKPTRPKRVKVVVVKRQGKVVLVERSVEGCLRRRTVPMSELIVGKDDYKILESVWNAGIVYGYDWETMIDLELTGADVGRAWKAAGIWTSEDLRREWNRAQMIVVKLCNPALVKVLKQTRR